MGFKIGLLGLGTVGTGVGEIFASPEGRHPLLQEIEIAKVGVRSLDKARSLNVPAEVLTTDLNAIINDPTIDMVVEVIGGLEPARSLILDAIAQGKHVVTANKAVIARYGEEIFKAATQAGVYVMIEAAVAGGIPVIQPLKESLGANRIHTLIGILNGTTNYILTKMQQSGAAFADVLAEAQALGYAEADPTADVEGLDAGDKIAILASLAFGGQIDLEQVHREGIRQISAADINYAKNLGFVIKLLAIAKVPTTTAELPPPQLEVRVHPTFVPLDHPLASVNDVFNALLIEADPLGQVMFLGPGAGAGPTASAVVADLINIAALLKTGIVANDPETSRIHPLLTYSHPHSCNIAPMTDLVTRFYARFLTKDHPGVIGKLGTVFGHHGVSLESVVQTDVKAGLAEIVVVTHDVQEGNFRQALDEIRQMAAIDSIPSLLRVL
ncbi:homoserine dehydrogenase [Acaryochloris sp. IP29b_bin.148]|uniref:homoserine dehydrogenase n=1 Tax=Acaryochloris sp. IP29b_bin.148 TaxID=2969218 RepID=UPI002615D2E2|nr:homoserine dehydrogenase [Acaryochloris sp. IP29b_bin.148]